MNFKNSADKEKFIITGKVIKGDRYGRILGFPTINLDAKQFARLKLKPRSGIYAGKAEFFQGKKRKIYISAIIISPDKKNATPKLEAHLLDFNGRLYGKKVTLHLLRRIRSFKKFKTEKSLKAQIRRDIKRVREIDKKIVPKPPKQLTQ